MIDSKTRTLIQKEITNTQNRMMDQALDVIDTLIYIEEAELTNKGVSKREVFDMVMKLYNNYTEALLQDIIIPLDDPTKPTLKSMDFAIIVKRLNKGLANFAFNIQEGTLINLIKEEQQRKELENPQQEETTDKEENNNNTEENTSFPQENNEEDQG